MNSLACLIVVHLKTGSGFAPFDQDGFEWLHWQLAGSY